MVQQAYITPCFTKINLERESISQANNEIVALVGCGRTRKLIVSKPINSTRKTFDS